ncbi:LysE family translocator [Leptothermofonsia sp. ETS-13]|uniref:LysE family translocator n=1 Tax=Leptothermofonsia sp. ETS-13 TaxID=3035696 RepID=UPI003BA1207F
MFSSERLLGFAIASIICTIAPGPDNLAVLSLGLSRGQRAGMGFALGCGLGCLTHTTWATLGVAATIAASEVAFQSLKFAGAAYLLYLGLMAFRSKGMNLRDVGTTKAQRPSFVRFMVRGFIANAINPKVALFFLAFLPQFVNPTAQVSLQMAILGILFCLIATFLFLLLGYFSGSIGTWLRTRTHIGQWLDRIAGCLFIGLGISLILSQKPI